MHTKKKLRFEGSSTEEVTREMSLTVHRTHQVGKCGKGILERGITRERVLEGPEIVRKLNNLVWQSSSF